MRRAALAIIVAGPLLLGTACGVPEDAAPDVGAANPRGSGLSASTTTPVGEDMPLVVATHAEGGTVPWPATACSVAEYGIVPGQGTMYAHSTPEEVLSEETARPGSGIPRRGWHRVNGNNGSVLFVYVSHGTVGATVNVATDGGTYGVSQVCGTDNGPPDLDWEPPPPPPPLGSTAEERRHDEENKEYRKSLPDVPGGTLVGTEPSISSGTLADTTLFHYAIQGRRCAATEALEQALLDAGFVGGGLETADGPTGSARWAGFTKGGTLVAVMTSTSRPGLTLSVATRPAGNLPISTFQMPCTID